MTGVEGKLLSVTDDSHTIGRDAKRHEVRLDRDSPPLPERQVVLRRASLIGVSFDRNHPRGILLQQRGIPRDDRASRIVEVGAVQREKYRLERRIPIEIVERPAADRILPNRLRRYGERLLHSGWGRWGSGARDRR